MRCVVDRNVVMRRIPVLYGVPGCRRKPPAHHDPNLPLSHDGTEKVQEERLQTATFSTRSYKYASEHAIYYFIYVEF